MQIRDIMSDSVTAVRHDASLRTAAETMRDSGVRMLPVVDDNDQLIGCVSDRDITLKAVAGGLDPASTPVERMTAGNQLTCREDDDIHEIGRVMQEHDIGRMLVCDAEGRPVGTVSLADIARCRFALQPRPTESATVQVNR